MSKQLFQAVAEVTKIETLAKGLKIILHTNELSPEQMTTILSLYEKQGWFLFKESEISEIDVKGLPDLILEPNEKSPSQRLRAVLYRIWEQSGGLQRHDKLSADQHYRNSMEKIIEDLKTRLN